VSDEPQLIYIAGPLSGPDQDHNVRQAVLTAEVCRRRGHVPIVPHLSVLWNMMMGSPIPWQEWIDYDLNLMRAVQRGGWGGLIRLRGDSPGADLEVEEATRLGIPIWCNTNEVKTL